MGSVFAKFFPRDDTLLLGERIGRGSYGEVYRGTLGRNRRPVAVKKIYDILLIAARENRQSLQHLVSEFRLECELLQVAKHPNVVEFIGVFYQGEGEESALLVMELMEQTLEHFLENNRGVLPQEKQVAICVQIASGLLFLHQHEPQILHRDLTAKNVLMNKEGSIAKISDFGQAKYRPTSVQYLTTKQPGTIPYMPPECLVDRPHFTHKGDLFSFGVLMLQVTTQELPSVGLVIREGQPEVERRAADLAMLPSDHPLKPLILQCLQDDPEERPSCSEILHYLLFGPQLDIPSVLQTASLQQNKPSLHFVNMPDLPVAMAFAVAVIIARNVYVCGGACGDANSAQLVQVFDLDMESWTTLPHAPLYNSQATAINDQLVLIGGQEASSRTITNLIVTWTGQCWQQDLPVMPTKRVRPGVTTLGNFVIVAGGMAEDKQTLLTSVDVLNTTTRQWWTPANLQLPRPMYAMSLTICSTNVTVASAIISPIACKRVWQLPVTALKRLLTSDDTTSQHVQWTEVGSTPNYLSSIFQSTAHIVAVGGRDSSTKPTSDLALYDSNCNKWSVVGRLPTPRMRCTAVSVSANSFLVLGGYSDAWNPRNTRLASVELVHVS